MMIVHFQLECDFWSDFVVRVKIAKRRKIESPNREGPKIENPLATEHAQMSVATALLCPDVLPIVSSRISVPGRSRSTPVDACGIEGPWRRNSSPPGWWALLIAAGSEIDSAELRHLVHGTNGGRAVAAAAARVRPPRPSNWGSMTKHQKMNWRGMTNSD